MFINIFLQKLKTLSTWFHKTSQYICKVALGKVSMKSINLFKEQRHRYPGREWNITEIWEKKRKVNPILSLFSVNDFRRYCLLLGLVFSLTLYVKSYFWVLHEFLYSLEQCSSNFIWQWTIRACFSPITFLSYRLASSCFMSSQSLAIDAFFYLWIF